MHKVQNTQEHQQNMKLQEATIQKRLCQTRVKAVACEDVDISVWLFPLSCRALTPLSPSDEKRPLEKREQRFHFHSTKSDFIFLALHWMIVSILGLI